MHRLIARVLTARPTRLAAPAAALALAVATLVVVVTTAPFAVPSANAADPIIGDWPSGTVAEGDDTAGDNHTTKRTKHEWGDETHLDISYDADNKIYVFTVDALSLPPMFDEHFVRFDITVNGIFGGTYMRSTFSPLVDDAIILSPTGTEGCYSYPVKGAYHRVAKKPGSTVTVAFAKACLAKIGDARTVRYALHIGTKDDNRRDGSDVKTFNVEGTRLEQMTARSQTPIG